MSSSSPAESSTTGFVDRLQEFVSENKRAVLIGTAAAVLAVGGAACYYYAATSGAAGRAGGGVSDMEKGVAGEKKKKNKGNRKKKAGGKDKQRDSGPILEEVAKPKVESAVDESEVEVLSDGQIGVMSNEERTEKASEYKVKGNAAYQARNFGRAVELYTQAIKVSPKPDPVFYSNRAACYINMSPPKHDLVIQDCDEALKMDPAYVKALNRRAMALEALERYDESLRDFTAATILDKFQNQSTAQAVERVLKKLSTKKAAEIVATREPRLPSYNFIQAYFAAFRPRSHPALPESLSQGDQTLDLALDALDASDFAHALSFVNESLEQGISWDAGKAEALNLRGTFKFLTGDVEGAKNDLLESIVLVPNFTQSLVKIASVYMEQGDPKKAFECFDEAIKHNPHDPDIYYHRGQVLFIMNEFTDAAENYTKSMELDDKFVFSHIQLAVAQYKSGNVANAMATFRRTLRAFPQRSEPQNYYGELLLDQQRFQDAVEHFDKAHELEQGKNSAPNVLPLVNKGLTLFQWKQDISAAERCCNEALRIDPECEAAVATLAQLNLQQGKIDKAVEMFEKQVDLARTEPELVNALTYQYASVAQVEFQKNFPAMAAQLNQIARGLF
ncbi:hypothetical protein AMATHDRAFT_137300 [Amanita thiersii Skay4041]|uniref:ADP/ATP carrier receptor n=1 Tax=Amanita thiersii Skay4041 TaxID=703135 RepID=A0A2A9NW58_9AGAR|nr:hypothetical protein AMATHDRAFT_137300 [Amanita thiersii Skay4041]